MSHLKSIFIFYLLIRFSCHNIFAQNLESQKFINLKNKFITLKNQKPSFQRDTLIINTLDSLRIYLLKTDQKYSKDLNIVRLLKKYTELSPWPKGISIYTFWKGIELSENGQHIKAIKHFELAEKQFLKLNDFSHQAYTLIKMGLIISMHYQDVSKSLEIIEKGIIAAKKSGNRRLIFMGLNAKGGFYSNQKKYLNALDTFKEYDNLNDTDLTNFLGNKLNIGICYLNIDSIHIGLNYILPAFNKLPSNTSHHKYLHWAVNEEIVQVLIKKKEYNSAKYFLSQAKKHYNFKDVERFSIYDYQINKGLHNLIKALSDLEKFRNYEVEKIKLTENEKLEGMKAQLELKEQSEKFQKAELDKLKAENEKQNQVRWLLIGLSLVGFLSSVYIVRTNRKLKQNNADLLNKNKEISEALLRGQTTERQRVAIDLHDNLGSTISSIKYSLEAIDRSKMNADELAVQENLYSLLDKAYNDVRLLSHNLLPEEFEKLGLAETLKSFVRKMNKNSKIKFELEVDESLGRLDKKVEFELYSICLELVTNIMKHSKATQAKITLAPLPPEGAFSRQVLPIFGSTHEFKHDEMPPLGARGLFLIVSDNGIGTFNNKSDGRGMKNVQARVDSINGTWTVKAVEREGVVNEILIQRYS